ncbi:MAG: hypothetical protein ACOYB3_00235 [Azonexus sp.]
MFQYACAKGYARKVGATLETHDWVGRWLFKGINDPIIKTCLPQLPLDVVPQNGETNLALYGYFQHKAAFELYTMADLKEWFQFQDWVLEEMADCKPVPLAAHIRRGDYVTAFKEHFCTVGEEAYTVAIVENGFGHLPVTWVREDKPREYKRPGVEWLIDFWTLYNADVVFRANSTFSWWAAALGKAQHIFSPVIEGKRGFHAQVPFVRGNHPRPTDQPNVDDCTIK